MEGFPKLVQAKSRIKLQKSTWENVKSILTSNTIATCKDDQWARKLLKAYDVFVTSMQRQKSKFEMEIISNGDYPANVLSNFHSNAFEIDGIPCASMEGFLQSLHFEDIEKQTHICSLSGYIAKRMGHTSMWYKTQTLYWNGQKYNRQSAEYSKLIDRAYEELSKNKEFVKALLATGTATLYHSIGGSDTHLTILTELEFTSRLTKIRARLLDNLVHKLF